MNYPMPRTNWQQAYSQLGGNIQSIFSQAGQIPGEIKRDEYENKLMEKKKAELDAFMERLGNLKETKKTIKDEVLAVYDKLGVPINDRQLKVLDTKINSITSAESAFEMLANFGESVQAFEDMRQKGMKPNVFPKLGIRSDRYISTYIEPLQQQLSEQEAESERRALAGEVEARGRGSTQELGASQLIGQTEPQPMVEGFQEGGRPQEGGFMEQDITKRGEQVEPYATQEEFLRDPTLTQKYTAEQIKSETQGYPTRAEQQQAEISQQEADLAERREKRLEEQRLDRARQRTRQYVSKAQQAAKKDDDESVERYRQGLQDEIEAIEDEIENLTQQKKQEYGVSKSMIDRQLDNLKGELKVMRSGLNKIVKAPEEADLTKFYPQAKNVLNTIKKETVSTGGYAPELESQALYRNIAEWSESLEELKTPVTAEAVGEVVKRKKKRGISEDDAIVDIISRILKKL